MGTASAGGAEEVVGEAEAEEEEAVGVPVAALVLAVAPGQARGRRLRDLQGETGPTWERIGQAPDHVEGLARVAALTDREAEWLALVAE